MEKLVTVATTSLGEGRRQRRGEGHQWRKRHEARRRTTATAVEVAGKGEAEEQKTRISDHCEPLRLEVEEEEDSSSCRTPERSERIPSIEEDETPIAIRWSSSSSSSSSRIASIKADRSPVIDGGDRWRWWCSRREGSLDESNDTHGTPPAHSCRRKETIAAIRRSSYSHWTNVHRRWLTLALVIAAIVLLGPVAVDAVAPKYETAYACEGKTLMIECENGDLINLIRANYGRFSITICNDHGNVDWSVNCMSPKSLRVLHSKCAQKQNCSVLASTTMFGDPCPGTHKYLEAHYQCVSAAQSSTTTNRPSPPWLKTSQPIVWSTSTVRSPVLSRLNITQHSPYDVGVTTPMVGVTVAAVSTSGVTARPPGIGGKLPGGQSLVPRGGGGGGEQQQHPASAGGQTTAFRNKGFENKNVNDDLAIIKTINDRKKVPGVSTTPTGGGRRPAGDPATDGEEDGGDLLPTQTAVLSGAPGPGVRKDVAAPNTNVVSVGGGIGPTGGGSIGGVNTLNNHPQGMAIDVSHACGPSTARNLFWNVTRVGEVNVQPCPGGATGIAKWRCVAVASLTPEQRVHLQQEHQQMLQLQGGASGTTVTTPTVATADGQADSSNKGDISFSSSPGGSSSSSSSIHLTSSDKQSLTETAAATWYAYQPDLTQCRSLWLNNLEVRVQQPDSSLISIANDLAQVTSSKTLYGGDMLVATKIVQTMSQKMHYDIETIPDQRQREALVFELLNSVVKTGSNLLDQSQHASWLDLSVEDQMRVATSLLTGLEDNAFLLADTILREKHVVQKVKNILISIRVLETRNFVKSVEIFPDSSTERWQVSSDQIELPKAALIENSEGGLVRIVFVAFDRLEQILRPQFSNIQHPSQQQQHSAQPGQGEPSQHPGVAGAIASANIGLAEGGSLGGSASAGTTRSDAMATSDPSGMPGAGSASTASHQQYQQSPRLRLLNSKVISASLGKGRHIQLSQPIRMVLKHLRTKNVSNPTCVFWNYIDHAWSEDGCHVEHTNQTHTVCMCNHLTNFALLVDAIDETQLSLLSIIDDDIKLLIYISVGILIVIGVIALFALKLFSGVFTKLRHGGEADHHLPAGVGVRGVVDRDGGLSISGHHGIGARMHHHHHHVGNNNAGVDLHHPNATAHHHHLVHHHLAGGGTAIGHHLLVADDFQQQQQQQQPGVNNLHNHHPNNLGNSHHHTMVNNNNLVTTTFNNLNGGGGGSGGSSCSPSPPGSGYEQQHHLHAAHHPGSAASQHLGRLNNNVSASSSLLSAGGAVPVGKPLTYRPNNQINLLRAATTQQQQYQQQQQQHHQSASPTASSGAPSSASSPSAAAAAAATFQQQQQQHQHHNQSQAAATAAGAILLQGFGGGGGGGSSGGRRPSSASSLIASTSLITQPLGAEDDGGCGGGVDRSKHSSVSSDHSSNAAELVGYNLSGSDLATAGGGGAGGLVHLHHHQGSIGSNASSGVLVVSGGGGGGGGGGSSTVGTITSSTSSSASASAPLLHHHHQHHHHQHHHHLHLPTAGAGSAIPIPSKRNI